MRTATSDTAEQRSVGLRSSSHRRTVAQPKSNLKSKPSQPLRAPQPMASTPVIPATPPLSAPQPRGAAPRVVPLRAPQPFSNTPEANLDGTEGGFIIRTTSITSSGNYSNISNNPSRKRGSRHSSSKRRFSQCDTHRDQHQRSSSSTITSQDYQRDFYQDRQRRSSSSTITSQDIESSCESSYDGSNTEQHSTGNSNTMEPENDAGAQPLHGNVIRRPSLTVSRAEAQKMPYAATVAHVGSGATAKTTESSFHSVASNHSPLYNNSNGNSVSNSNSNQEIMRKNSYKKKYPPLSRSFKTMSFSGDITSSSRIKRSASMNHDEENNNNSQRGKRSSSTTDGRISSTSFSMEMQLPGSREISKEFSLVANVIDEAQLETEFIERMKKRMVEAVEIRPSHTEDEEDPHTTINSSSSKSNNNSNSRSSSSNNGESSSHRESTPNGDGNDGGGTASGIGDASGNKMTTSEKARLREKKRMKRCVCAWIGFVMAIAVLAAVLVLFLKFSKVSQNLVTDDP